MRRSSLVGFVARIFPSMSPVRGIPPPVPPPSSSTTRATSSTTPSTCRLGSSVSVATTSSSTTTSSRNTTRSGKNNPVQEEEEQQSPPVLLLEGDNFEVSHDGVARTFYHLRPDASGCLSPYGVTPSLGIEEYYDLKEAHKTFVLRRPQGWEKEDEEEQSQQGHDDYTEILLGSKAQGLAPMGRPLGRVDIQEIDEGVFGLAGTGATTWESSLAMGLFFAEHPDLLRGALLEIGSGVGVGAILSHMGPLACKHDLRHLQSVTLTDGNEQCLQQCRQNIRQAWENLSMLYPPTGNPPQVNVFKLDWNTDVDNFKPEYYDTIIACDVCYLYPDIEPLAQTIHKLLKKDGCLHLFGPYNRGAFQHLCQRLNQDMHVTIESLGLERYRLKPADTTDRPPSCFDDTILPRERLYASKSQATILHVSVRHRNAADNEPDSPQQSVDMRDLD